MPRFSKKIARRSKKQLADRTLLTLIGVLLLFGLISIYDATVVLSQDLYGNAYIFVISQLVWMLLGLGVFYFFYKIDLKILRKYATPIFLISLAFLLILALFGVLPCSINFIFTPCINGANRWFYFNPPPLPPLPFIGIVGFQPSEFAKFSLIVFLAAQLEKATKSKDLNSFIPFMIVSGLSFVLVFLQPNLSTATLILFVSIVMYFASGADLKPALITFPSLGLIGAVALFSFSHTRERIKTFLMGGTTGSDLSTGYHIKQILIALGSGGIFGVGFGQSRQKFQYLPEVFADSIFAIIGEELGFIGTTMLVLLFAFLIYKGFTIAKHTSHLFDRLLAVGITTWVALQFFVNVGAMTRLIPLTGVPLPLISYGGSSLVFMLMGLGVLANVSKK